MTKWYEPPYTAECPVCHAQPGLPCVGTYQGRLQEQAPHQERARATIDESKPPTGNTPAEGLVVCAVCGRSLDYDAGAGRYTHNFQDQLEEDHPAVMALASEVQHNARCDFCNADVQLAEIWTVPADTFELPQVVGITGGGTVELARHQISVGAWAACQECVNLIQRDRWSALIARVKANYDQRHDGSVVDVVWLRALYRKLAVHINGEPYPGPTRGADA